jgi:hypothetical protein
MVIAMKMQQTTWIYLQSVTLLLSLVVKIVIAANKEFETATHKPHIFGYSKTCVIAADKLKITQIQMGHEKLTLRQDVPSAMLSSC